MCSSSITGQLGEVMVHRSSQGSFVQINPLCSVNYSTASMSSFPLSLFAEIHPVTQYV